MSDDELVHAIIRSWRSVDPYDDEAKAVEAVRVMHEALDRNEPVRRTPRPKS